MQNIIKLFSFSFFIPDDILRRILLEVVKEDGDVAFNRLSLTCRKFRDVVSNESFRNDLGHGKKGVLGGFYSSKEFTGYCCSHHCFIFNANITVPGIERMNKAHRCKEWPAYLLQLKSHPHVLVGPRVLEGARPRSSVSFGLGVGPQ
jgi:hypothetical protein